MLFGGAGDDTIDGGADSNTLDGGDGIDTLIVGTRTELGTGNNSNFENLKARDSVGSSVELLGDSGPNIITGSDHDDAVLEGGGGNDTIYGGKGDDDLEGGTGKGTLTGGEGEDCFKLDASGTAEEIAATFDTITDYKDEDAITTTNGTARAMGGKVVVTIPGDSSANPPTTDRVVTLANVRGLKASETDLPTSCP